MFITYFLKFLKVFSQGYRMNLALLFVSSFVAGALEFLGIALVFPLIIIILKPETLNNIEYLSFLSSKYSPHATVLILSVLIAGAFVVKNLFMMADARYKSVVLKKWRAQIKASFFKRYLYSEYKSKNDIASKYSVFQLEQITDIVFSSFVQRVLNLLACVVILGVIFVFLVVKFKEWAILTSLFFVVSGACQNKFFKTKGRELNKKMVEFVDRGTKAVFPALRNIKDIKIFGRENYFYTTYENITREKSKVEADIDFYLTIPQSIVELCIIFAIIIMSYGVVATSSGHPDEIIASFGLLAAAMFRMAPVVNKVQVHMNFINSSKPVVDTLLDAEALYRDMSVSTFVTDEVQPFKNSITIKDLSFGYGEDSVFEGLNIAIGKGEFVGIIGASGVGKTTFVDVLMGLLAPTNGEIFIDNEKLAGKTVSKWINAIGYVPQEVTTLPVSIAQNVAFGVEEDEIDYNRVAAVLEQAELSEYVEGLSDGVMTKLADATQSLSQGQKQRVGIARALYKNTDILFLDEITSALDVETENKITDCLNSLKGEKTIVAIAHRLSTLKKCDRILYFKSKNIVLSGTFDELCAQDAEFENIIKLSEVRSGSD